MHSAVEFRRLVGANIQKARWLRALTQQSAAEATGLNHRYLQEIERGARNPTLDVLFAISTVLDVAVADLVDVGDRPRLETRLVDTEASPPPRGRKPKPSRAPGRA